MVLICFAKTTGAYPKLWQMGLGWFALATSCKRSTSQSVTMGGVIEFLPDTLHIAASGGSPVDFNGLCLGTCVLRNLGAIIKVRLRNSTWMAYVIVRQNSRE